MSHHNTDVVNSTKPLTPQQKGYNAFFLNDPLEFNPFINKEQFYNEWNRGWHQAKKDHDDAIASQKNQEK